MVLPNPHRDRKDRTVPVGPGLRPRGMGGGRRCHIVYILENVIFFKLGDEFTGVHFIV